MDVIISGKLSALAKTYNMDNETFVGFMDGINNSLKDAVTIDALEKNSEITLDIDPEKLYFHMLEAKADWLYSLPQWDNLLTDAKRKEIKKAYNTSKIVVKDPKIGRNDPCPCGSGRKYKQCCMNK
jgi:preprotein translocase subunit SecA